MSGAESSSRQHFSGYVDKAGEPCGGQRMRVRQNRVVLSASYFFGLLKAAEVTENVGIFRLAPFN